MTGTSQKTSLKCHAGRILSRFLLSIDAVSISLKEAYTVVVTPMRAAQHSLIIPIETRLKGIFFVASLEWDNKKGEHCIIKNEFAIRYCRMLDVNMSNSFLFLFLSIAWNASSRWKWTFLRIVLGLEFRKSQEIENNILR